MTPSVKIPFNARNHTGPTNHGIDWVCGNYRMKPKDKALIVSLIQEGFTG
jgi:hypothetical protein